MAKANRVLRTCSWCAVDFMAGRASAPVRRRTGHQHNRCCSRSCALRLRAAENHPWDWWPRPTSTRIWVLDCGYCGSAFISRHPTGQFCSRACREITTDPRRSDRCGIGYGDCRECGSLYVIKTSWPSAFCSKWCATRRTRRKNKQIRRTTSAAGDDFTLRELAERDNWTCHLCGELVPDQPYTASADDPTIDHLIPVTQGGPHTWENVKLAHNRCNWERGAPEVLEWEQGVLSLNQSNANAA